MPKLATLTSFFRAPAFPKADDDRGAITTLFAILLGSGMLLAILGLVVDGGQVMVEKQLVRKAADSVAEAVAIHCAKTNPGTNCLLDSYQSINAFSGGTTGTAGNSDYLSTLANPRGGNIVVSLVCGQTGTSVGISPCPPLTGGANDCVTDLGGSSQYKNWIRVYTSTDPNGIQPAFENFLNETPQAYQETACSQVYWGTANAINVDTSNRNQLPFMIGICEVQPANFDKTIELLGDTATNNCQFNDRNGTSVSSNTRGFVQFEPSTTSSACWSLGSTTCTNLPLDTTKARTSGTYPQLSYSGLVGALSTWRTTLTQKKTIMLPVVTRSGSTYTIQSYVAFTLLGYNFPLAGSLTAASTKSAYKTYCAGTPTTTSSYCIAGQFSSRVYGTYGQVSGLGITTSSSVPNLGYQVIKHIR